MLGESLLTEIWVRVTSLMSLIFVVVSSAYLNAKEVGEEQFENFSKQLDLGDWIGVEGENI